MYSFGYVIIFMMQMMFSGNVVNTKVVYNLLILLVLEFHDHRPDGLGVIDFTNSLSGFAYALCSFEGLFCLTYLHVESYLGDSRRVVALLLSFQNCLRALLLLFQNSSYSYSKWNDRFYPNLDRDVFLVLYDLVS
jgi:hypothetical protein